MPDWLGWEEWFEQHFLWYSLESAVGALMALTVVKKGLNLIADNKSALWFFGGSFLGLLTLTFLFGREPVSTKPKLVANVEHVMWGGKGDSTSQLKSPVFIIVAIRNIGSIDSIADKYKLILSVNGRSYTGNIEELRKWDNIKLRTTNGMCTVLYAEDALDIKTLNTIKVGGSVTGILLFTFTNLESDALSQDDISYTLQFRDILGSAYTVKGSTISRNPSSLYIPGIRQDTACH